MVCLTKYASIPAHGPNESLIGRIILTGLMRYFALLAFSVGLGSHALATTLTMVATADDYMDSYISTSDTAQGTQFQNKTTLWSTIDTVSTPLTAGVDNYLHIRARDAFGAPSMLIANLSLGDGLFKFDNGTQNLLSNAGDWKVSLTGFGTAYQTPTDLGGNGTLVWGNLSGLSTARHIWSTSSGGGGEHYFSVKITAVPEPATLLTLGLGALALRRRRA